MRSFFKFPAAAMTFVLLSLGAQPSSQAAVTITAGLTVTNLNMRAGPGTHYPVVTVLPGNAEVAIYGCIAGATWCDVSFGNSRGWVSSNYLRVAYQNRTVVLTPSIAPAVGLVVVTYDRAYWNTHYAGRPWYGAWNSYYRPHGGAAVGCNGNGCAGVAVRPGRKVAVGKCSDGTCEGTVVRRTPRGPVVRHGTIARN